MSVLNAEASEGSARLFAAVLRRTLLRGGRYCLPCHPQRDLTSTFVQPAVDWLEARAVTIHYVSRVLGLSYASGSVCCLHTSSGDTAIAADEAVIVAVPPDAVSMLVPQVITPQGFCSIVNVHFRVAYDGDERMIGLWGGYGDWIFLHPEHISVTKSRAQLVHTEDKDHYVRRLWSEVALTLGWDCAKIPPYRFLLRNVRHFFRVHKMTTAVLVGKAVMRMCF